jgi:predicted amidohydrolase
VVVTRVGLAQLRYDADEVDRPDRRAGVTVAAVERLAAAGAEIVVLPELAACGYVLEPDHLARNAEPSTPTGPVVGAWADAARRLGVTVVGGYAERIGEAVFNTAVAIGPTGDVAGRYRKLHLFGPEHQVMVPGDAGLPVVDLGRLRVGLLVCYDLRFPETVRILALQGADAVIVPTAWVGGFDASPPVAGRFIGQIEAALVHANLNQVYVLCADFAGRQRDVQLLGRSIAIDPFGTIVAGPASADEPAVLCTDVDPATVAAALERGAGISPRANRRTDVYGELLGYVGDEAGR